MHTYFLEKASMDAILTLQFVIDLKHRLNRTKDSLKFERHPLQDWWPCWLAGQVHFAGRGARHNRKVVPGALCKDQTRLAPLKNQLNRSARKTH